MPTENAIVDYWLEMPPSDDELVFDDAESMDSPEYRNNLHLLFRDAHAHFAGRSDVYVGANEALYFSAAQARNRYFRAPDFFVVLGCDGKKPRTGWVVWNEDGKVPDIVIELVSPATEQVDRTLKLDTYRRIGVGEYVLYDVRRSDDPEALTGYVRTPSGYGPMPRARSGRLYSQALGLELGFWRGAFWGIERPWLRFFRHNGTLGPTAAEAEAQRAEAEAQRAEAEAQRPDDLAARLAAYEARFGKIETLDA